MALAKFGVVVLDCPDPRALAGFYAGVLGGTVEGEGDWVDLKVPGGPQLAFQEAPGFVPPGGRRRTARSSSTWTCWWRTWTRRRRGCWSWARGHWTRRTASGASVCTPTRPGTRSVSVPADPEETYMASVARLRNVVLDCPDPHALAAFYAAVAGGTPEPEDDDWVVLQVPDGPRLAFQRAEGHTPPGGRAPTATASSSIWTSTRVRPGRTSTRRTSGCSRSAPARWTWRTASRRTSRCTPTRPGTRSACAGSSGPDGLGGTRGAPRGTSRAP